MGIAALIETIKKNPNPTWPRWFAHWCVISFDIGVIWSTWAILTFSSRSPSLHKVRGPYEVGYKEGFT